jgi:Amt family ammonium transporter
MRPHNMTLVMLGAGILWFGWFGFNAGSALAAGTGSSVEWVNTLVAGCAAMLGWLAVEKVRNGHPTSLGAASGVVAGLVAITPSAGSVSPIGAIVIGFLAAIACAYAVGLKYKLGYDDSLDVVGVHFVGGVVGTLLIGFLADPLSPAGKAGLLYGGGLDQLWRQAVAAVAVMVYAFVVSYLIALVIKKTIGWRISPADELSGIDLAEHSEAGYDLSPVYYTNKVQRTLVLTKDDLVESEKTGASK